MKILTVTASKLQEWADSSVYTWMASLRPVRKRLVTLRGPMQKAGCCGKGSRVRAAAQSIPQEVWDQVLTNPRFKTDMLTIRQQLRMDRLAVRVGSVKVDF